MPNFYLYSNLLGSYVFDQKFYVIDKAMFRESDILANSLKLEQGKFLDEEKQLIDRHKKVKFTVIGFKTEKFSDAEAAFDAGIYGKICDGLKKDRDIYSRLRHFGTMITKQKIRNAVNPNILITQAIDSIVELEKVSNTVAKRLREWYGYYLPEFSESISDHRKFAEIIAKKDKAELLRELRLKKEESMGADMKKEDLNMIIELAKSLLGLYRLKDQQQDYLEKMMKDYCPNMQAIAGTLIAAKLLGRAGSLKRLVEFPSSTIQVLGAEEAFFRHMTTGAKMPKYGYISQHEFINKVSQKDKGKIARALADKISIASKIDYFKGEFMGDRLRKMVEEKVKAVGKEKSVRRESKDRKIIKR